MDPRSRYQRQRSAATVVSASVVVPTEKQEEREIVRLYETLGCEIAHFSQPRHTMQTEGIPDLKVYCRRKGLTWWHEAKAAGGRQSKAQVAFEERARACGEHYVLGGWLAAVIAVRAFGLVPPDWKPVEEL